MTVQQVIYRAHFDQGTHYYSYSHDAMQEIATMHPAHARNAAEKLMRDAAIHAEAAGINPKVAHIWMSGTALVIELKHRALGTSVAAEAEKITEQAAEKDVTAVALMDGDGTVWYLRVDDFGPGMYAMTESGSLPWHYEIIRNTYGVKGFLTQSDLVRRGLA